MNKRKLLLIVDDWELLERYEERLAGDFEVYCAPLGSEGLRIAAEQAPDAVLINLCFENMTNVEACAALRDGVLPAGAKILAVPHGDESGGGPDAWFHGVVSAASVREALDRCRIGNGEETVC